MTPREPLPADGATPHNALGAADLSPGCVQVDYMTFEYRAGHEAADIQALLVDAARNGWRLHTVLPDCRVLILESELELDRPLERMTVIHLDDEDADQACPECGIRYGYDPRLDRCDDTGGGCGHGMPDDDGLGEDLFPDPDREPWHFCAEHTARGFRHPAVELADCPWCHIPTAVLARLQAAQRDAHPSDED